MIINYDRSRVTVSDKELMRYGYADEEICKKSWVSYVPY